MKKTLYCFLSFVFILGAGVFLTVCDPYSYDPYSVVAITGAVTITCNGIPWNEENFPQYRSSNIIPNTDNARAIIEYPFSNLIRITAREKNFGSGISYGIADRLQNDDALTKGKYRWTMEIPENALPRSVYFEVICGNFGLLNRQMDKIIDKEILINKNKNSEIDLGAVNFDVMRLWGNLPITVNGEAFEHQQIRMTVRKTAGQSLGLINFTNDWNWSANIFSQDSEEQLEFIIEAGKNGGIFRKTLNAGYTVNPEYEKEITFSDYTSGIDFDAHSLSGTMKVDFPASDKFEYTINFYNSDRPPNLIASKKVTDSMPDENGIVEWEALVPASPFLPELQFAVVLSTDSLSLNYNGSIVITEELDLSSINLGTFVVK